jgi:hypothetical protein
MDSKLIGKVATVSATVPAEGKGYGEVIVEVRGGTASFNAVTGPGDPDPIPARSMAVVVDEMPGSILVVSSYP